MRRSRRLSVTFRFRADGIRLDNKSGRDLERLVDFMADHREGRLLLLGFAEPGGDPVAAATLSQSLADRVAHLLAVRGIHAKVEGLGGVLPVAAPGTPPARQRNRRVEVWLF